MDTFVKAKYTLRTLDNHPFSNDLSVYDKQNYEKCLKGQIPRGQLTKVGEEQLAAAGLSALTGQVHGLDTIYRLSRSEKGLR